MVEITNENGIEVIVSDPSIEADVVNLNELDIRVSKKEYTIVGDDIYIPKLYDDAPEWMKNLVQIVVDVSLETGNTDLINQLNSVLSEFATQYVPLNQYTQSILDLSNEDTRINAVIETLNSNYNDGISEANAQIIGLQLTKASKTEVVAQVLQTISAELQNDESNLGAVVARLDQAIADESSARAMSFETVMASMESLDGTVSGEASATSKLYAYVGYERDGSTTGTGLLADVQILQKQNDGVIETYTGTYDVMIGIEDPNNNTDNDQLDATKEPYASWIAEDTLNGNNAVRSSHTGDVFIKYSTSEFGYKTYIRAYKFIRTIPDATSPYSTDLEGFTWAVISDTDAQNAYIAALNALDLADDKRRVYVGLGTTTTPSVPYDQGDLWLIDAARTVNGYACKVGDILRCLESKGKVATYEENDWVLTSSYANAVAAEAAALETWKNTTYASTIATIQTQVDGKAETFYQSSIPTGRIKSINVPTNSTLDKYVGDLWKNTYVGTTGGYLGDNTEYIYTKTANGSNWNYDWTKMEVPDIVFDTIDTKKSIYSGNSLPVAVYPDVIELNDMWITGDTPVAPYVAKSIYVWSKTGSNPDTFRWVIPVKYTDDTATVALQTGLVNGTVIVNLASATIDGSKALTTYVAEEIDKEVVIYSGTNHATQTGMKSNDIYIEKTTAVSSSGITIDVVNTWKYNGSAWVQIGNNSNLTALADLTDGKRTIYSGTSLPINSTLNPLRPNDLFIPTSTFVANTITYTANEMYRYNGVSWEKATRYDEIKSLLQTQIDNKIETTYGGATPPYANRTNVAKDPRGGDYWYCDTDGAYLKGNVYKYTETANGSNFNYTWTLSSDVSKGAFDLADKKRIIFGNAGNSVPTLGEGLALADIWIPSSDGSIYLSGKVYKCTNLNPIAFVEVDYTNDEVVNGIISGTTPLDPNTITIGNINTTFLEYITAEIDGKVGVYSGETAPVNGQPSGVAVNDIYLWFTTASKVLANGTTQVYDITRTYKYSGTVWNEITTDSNIVALADLADGKRTVFSGNTVPVGSVDRDIWIPSADVSITTSAMCSVANGTWNGTSCSVSKYYQGEVYQFSATGKWIVATKYTANLEAVRTNLQGQLDGKVETYYQATVPTGMTALNNGDYWYCTADVSTYKKGKVYKYVHATTSWAETADVSRYAFDVADGKAAIFSSTNLPTSGYKINDMLIVVGSFNNGTTTFADGVVLSSTANRTSGFTPADWVKKINDTEDLDAFVSGTYTPTVTSLQNQVDGKVESWFQNSTSDPKTAWTDAATRSKHDGDLWYQLDTNRSYWYSSSTNAWNLIDDEKAIQALTNAAAAQTSANNAQTSANTANSLLADIASDNKLVPSEKVAVKKEWDIIQSEYTKNWAQGNVYGVSTSSYTSAYNSLSGYITPLLSSLTTTSDIVGTTFRNMFKAYYDANVDVLNAVANKINAIADGKITSYYIDTFSSLQALSNGWTTAEKTSNVGDLATVWNDSTLDNNGLWRWNGTSWVSARDKKLVSIAGEVTNLSTELNNGTNTWASADSELENSLRTEISSEGARVESKFAYNSTLVLNGTSYSSGFGIATSLTSGSGLPTGQSEFWIKADKFKLMSADGSKKSSYSPFTVDSVTGEINFNGKVSFNSIPRSPTNIIAETWSEGNGSTPLYNIVGSSYENARIYMNNPSGQLSVVWACIADGTGNSDGGWDTVPFQIDRTKTYRFSVFIKTNQANGSSYLGCGPNTVTTLNSSTKDGNPYFWYGDLPSQNEWYLLVGYVYPSGKTGLVSNGGIYSCTNGRKVANTTDFNWAADAVNSNHRCYLYYSDSQFTRQFMYDPRVEMVDGNEPSILDMINTTNVGYSPSEVVSSINGGQTTTIDGGKITTGSITASQINTVGLIAENISANEIVGKTMTGSIINGASINGSVIKTSYLDLDGDLEVLTDYHLCTSQSQLDALLTSGGDGRLVGFNDKVENGGDAIFMEASNEYRIPTLSSISEPIQTYTGKGTKTLVGSIFPYNYTTANSNLKSRKKRPTITVTNTSVIYSSNSLGPNAYLDYNGGYYPLLPNTPNFGNGNGTLVEIWFGGVLLVRFGSYYPYDITHRCYVYDALTQTYVDGGIYLTYSPGSLDKTLTLTTSTFDVKLHYTREYSQYCDGEGCYSSSGGSLTLSLLSKSFVLPFDFTFGNLEIRSIYSSNEADFNLTIPSGIIINNMI